MVTPIRLDIYTEIERLEVSKTTSASIFSYVPGVVGTVFLAGAVFAYLADMVPRMVILAVPGFIG